MKPRSLPHVLALIAAPLALFRRKAKDGWLGELEEIRGQALGEHQEIGAAMADPVREPEAKGPHRPDPVDVVNDRHAEAGGFHRADDGSGHRAEELADGTGDQVGVAGDTFPAARPVDTPDVTPDRTAAAASRHADAPGAAPAADPGAALPATGRVAASGPVPVPVPVSAPVAGAGPVEATRSTETAAGPTWLSSGARPPRPAPHREHPSQLWHAPLELSAVRIPPEIAPEERIAPSDLVEPTAGDEARQMPFAPSRAPGAPSTPMSGPAPAAPSATVGPATGLRSGPPAVVRPEGLESFDDRVAHRNHHDTSLTEPAVPVASVPVASDPAATDPFPPDPPVDVFSGRDLVDEVEPAGPVASDAHQAAGATTPAGRPRIGPPTDIFDVAPAERLAATEADIAARGLGREPVSRRSPRAPSRRSLFGGGGQSAAASGRPPAAADPFGGDGRALEVGPSGELVDDQGTIRLAERTRPSIVRTPAGDSFAVDVGWCWVARGRAANPAHVDLPAATLVVPGGTRALAVVESDSSTFVSVVAGTAHLEHPSGRVTIGSGSIAHIPLSGTVTVDTASADEMAADAILTRNLRLDDALDAIADAKGSASGNG